MKSLTYLAAAAMIASMGLVGCEHNDQADNTNPDQPEQSAANSLQSAPDTTGNGMNNAAQATNSALSVPTTNPADLAQQASFSTDAPDARSIRNTIADTVNAALTKDGFSSLCKDFTGTGRAQTGDYSKLDFTELNGIVAQINGQWKSQYGNDFNSSEDAYLDNSVQVRQGDTTAAQPNTGDMTVAIVTLVPNSGFDGAIVMFKQEGVLRDWYITPPSTLTAQRLRANLLRELTAVKDSHADWPADQKAAYRRVADHVFAAIMDQSH